MLDTRGKLLAAEPRRASGERSNNPMVRRRYQSGSLFLRGKRTKVWVGRWVEQVIAADGSLRNVRRSVVLGTRAEIQTRRKAQSLLDSRLRDINQGLHKPQSTTLFRQFVCSQWEPAILPTLKFSTARSYKYLLHRHLLPAFGDKPLCEIERANLQQFIISTMVHRGLSWQSSANLRNLLSKILGTAVEWVTSVGVPVGMRMREMLVCVEVRGNNSTNY